MGAAAEDADATVRRREKEGAADIGDALLGNFLQGMSGGAKSAPADTRHGEEKTGKSAQAGKEKKHRDGKEKKQKKDRDQKPPLVDSQALALGNGQTKSAVGAAGNSAQLPSVRPEGKRKQDDSNKQSAKKRHRNEDKLQHGRSLESARDESSEPIAVQAAAIDDDTADDILGSFLRKVLGSSEPSPSKSSTAEASPSPAASSSHGPARSPHDCKSGATTSLPQVGELLSGTSHGRHRNSTQSHHSHPRSSPSAAAGTTSGGSGTIPVAAPASSVSAPSATPQRSPVANSTGAIEGGADSSDSNYSSSSSSASQKPVQLNSTLPAASPPGGAVQQRPRTESDSSSSSSSSSAHSSTSRFSDLYDVERPQPRPASVMNASAVAIWGAKRRACAKMSVITRLRCACHFALLRSCPVKGSEAIGNEYCSGEE